MKVFPWTGLSTYKQHIIKDAFFESVFWRKCSRHTFKWQNNVRCIWTGKDECYKSGISGESCKFLLRPAYCRVFFLSFFLFFFFLLPIPVLGIHLCVLTFTDLFPRVDVNRAFVYVIRDDEGVFRRRLPWSLFGPSRLVTWIIAAEFPIIFYRQSPKYQTCQYHMLYVLHIRFTRAGSKHQLTNYLTN